DDAARHPPPRRAGRRGRDRRPRPGRDRRPRDPLRPAVPPRRLPVPVGAGAPRRTGRPARRVSPPTTAQRARSAATASLGGRGRTGARQNPDCAVRIRFWTLLPGGALMQSTMQDFPLTITTIMRYGAAAFGDVEVSTRTGAGSRRRGYAEIGERAARLAGALRGLGVDGDQRVATFMWNNTEHLEAYLAVPSMGAVLHTLNLRLFPDQLVYIANHAEDYVVIVDGSLIPLLAGVLPQLKTVRHVIVVGEGDTSPLDGAGKELHSYEDLLAAAPPTFDWPEIDERSAAAMCYTSGTTGNPKGVVYSHRSAYLHSMAASTGNAIGLSASDRVLPVVPMFHANAWGLPYAAVMAGAALIMPDRFLPAEPLVRLIETERPTVAGAVPTIWADVLRHTREHGSDLSSLRLVPCGGSAVPEALMRGFDEIGVRIVQAWGMTETSPVATVAHPPPGSSGEEAWPARHSQRRVLPWR